MNKPCDCAKIKYATGPLSWSRCIKYSPGSLADSSQGCLRSYCYSIDSVVFVFFIDSRFHKKSKNSSACRRGFEANKCWSAIKPEHDCAFTVDLYSWTCQREYDASES